MGEPDPGMSDEAVERATGKRWEEWFAILDSWNGTTRTHAEMARYLADEQSVSGWWAQMITVGYERARGMRARHQHLDDYSVSVSRTFNVPVERLYGAFADASERNQWLEPGLVKERPATALKVWRCEVVEGGSRVEVRFTVKGPDKTSIAIEHAKLSEESSVAHWRAFWKERLDQLASVVAR
jgi:hypothetical protein